MSRIAVEKSLSKLPSFGSRSNIFVFFFQLPLAISNLNCSRMFTHTNERIRQIPRYNASEKERERVRERKGERASLEILPSKGELHPHPKVLPSADMAHTHTHIQTTRILRHEDFPRTRIKKSLFRIFRKF